MAKLKTICIDGDCSTVKEYSAGKNINITDAGVISAPNVYSKSEVDDIVDGLASGSYEVVQTLPSTGDSKKIYLVPSGGTAPNIYDEYIYVNGAWEKIGDTQIDLSNYPTRQDLTDLAEHVDETKQDKLTAGDNITISGNTISAKDTTYTAGENITIENGVISASGVDPSRYPTWADMNDLAEHVDETKQDKLTAGDNITISGNTISAEEQKWTKDYPSLGSAKQGVVQNDVVSNTAGTFALAQGTGTSASGEASHAEGVTTNAQGAYSHAEGDATEATGKGAHASGRENRASGDYSHTEGSWTVASGLNSHAEGQGGEASGLNSHVEGQATVASGARSHAEGFLSKAIGEASHAEGLETSTGGNYSHAEGAYSHASGVQAHAEGQECYARGANSHAHGLRSEATKNAQTVLGRNAAGETFTTEADYGTYVEIVGNGGSASARSNARTLDWNGNEWLAGTLESSGLLLTAPNGTKYKVTIDNSGNLTSTAV